ncbi:MAG: hypothetical protein AAF547_25295, partial [Actinomycetota bacterium]
MTAAASIGSTARGLIVPVYTPWLGMSLCVGMVSVALPLHLEDGGVGVFELSLVLAAAGLGSALGGVPAGDAVSRVGSGRLMLLGSITVA